MSYTNLVYFLPNLFLCIQKSGVHSPLLQLRALEHNQLVRTWYRQRTVPPECRAPHAGNMKFSSIGSLGGQVWPSMAFGASRQFSLRLSALTPSIQGLFLGPLFPFGGSWYFTFLSYPQHLSMLPFWPIDFFHFSCNILFLRIPRIYFTRKQFNIQSH